MIKMLLLAGRDRNRLGEILHVASRFGLGVILQRLGIERSADVRDDGPDADAMPLPRRTRLALEELWPTCV